MSSAIEVLRSALQILSPTHLDILDESLKHAGHASAREGGHYAITIVSVRFRGLSRISRHRLIYATLGDLMRIQVHALAIKACTPEEV